LGGLLSGLPTTVCVQAYDASGNVSDCEPFDHTLSLEPIPPLGAPQRLSTWGGSISVGRDPETYMRVRWAAPDSSTGTPDGYYLSYHIAGCVGPNPSSLADQGPSPIDSTSPYTLTGLTVGQTYRIAVNAYNDWGFVGPKVETFAMFIDYADADFDGMPDQWVELYNITDGPGGDADGDGLTNLEEYGLKSNPRYADSDSDGYYDGEEVDWGSNVCGPEHPPYHAEPKLTLAGNGDIEFTIASNQVSAVPQIIQIHNLGGGTLDWTAVSSDPWIIVGSDSGSGMSPLPIGVDTSELGVGHYIGTITIRNVSPVSMTLLSRTSAAQQEEVIINVELDVIPPKDFVYTFLPLVSR